LCCHAFVKLRLAFRPNGLMAFRRRPSEAVSK